MSDRGGSQPTDHHNHTSEEELSHIPTFKDVRRQPNIHPYNKGLPTISSVFKRTCYKCGNLGHHADDCEHETRLCYNCKKPGHESSECQEEKNFNVKQCYRCKMIGHIQAECPTLIQTQLATRRRHFAKNQQQHKPGKMASANTYPQQPPPVYTNMRYFPLPHSFEPAPQAFISRRQHEHQPQHRHSAPAIFPHGYLSYQQVVASQYAYPLLGTPQMVNPHYTMELLRLRSYSYDSSASQRLQAGLRTCYNCGEPGHDLKSCPQRNLHRGPAE